MGGLTPTSTSLSSLNTLTKEEFKDVLDDAKQALFLMKVGEISIAAFIKTKFSILS